MSQLVYFGGASGANQNLNAPLQTLGKGANGDGVSVAAAIAAHTKGSWVSIGTPSADLAGIILWVGAASSSSARYLLDIRRNGATVIAHDLYQHPGASLGWRPIFLPLNVPSGQALEVAVQGSVGSVSLRCYIEGVERTAQSAPAYSEMVALNADTVATRAGTVDVPLTNAWTELLSSTGETFPAFMALAGLSTSNPAGIQSMSMEVGTGAASSETHLCDLALLTDSTDPRVRPAMTRVHERELPNARAAARILAATPGSDNLRVGLYGFRA